VQGAISYFSEVGFAGDTTALAKRLGVAQALLYRYFENKDALIARVFEETFLANWNPLWEDMLTKGGEDVAARLLTFHRDFARVHLRRERVRLSLFFALHGWDMQPYFRLMRERVYNPIAAALREYAGASASIARPISELEVELAKTVVEKIQYYGIRKWVYELPVPEFDPLIGLCVHSLLDGAAAALAEPKAILR
jgi:AcrR family transcriptional regulator